MSIYSALRNNITRGFDSLSVRSIGIYIRIGCDLIKVENRRSNRFVTCITNGRVSVLFKGVKLEFKLASVHSSVNS